MSKRFESIFPKLAQAIKDNKVLSLTDDDGIGVYIMYDKNGKEVTLGVVGNESQVESKL
jgi:hypothetical protein